MNSTFTNRVPLISAILALAALLLSPATVSIAATKNWNTGSGNWNVPGNWNPSGVPGAGDIANMEFSNTDNVSRTITYNYTGSAVTLGRLTIDNADIFDGPQTVLSMSANSLTAVEENVGFHGNATFTQSGGINSVGGLYFGSNQTLNEGVGIFSLGIYSLSGTGSLAAGSEAIGFQGTGMFNQSGGTNTVINSSGLTIGETDAAFGTGYTPNSTYTLSGGSATVSGSVTLGSADSTGVLSVSGTGTLTVGGTVLVRPGSQVNLNGGTISAPGNSQFPLNWTSGTLHLTSDLTLLPGSALFPGQALTLGTNRTLIVTGNETVPGGSGVQVGAYSLTVASGGMHTVTGNLTVGDPIYFPYHTATLMVSNGGALSVGGLLSIVSAGTAKGNSTITANVQNGGVVAPGLSPGILYINGNYTQTAAGKLQIELGGTTVGTQYDQLNVTGSATLDGTLQVSLINSFSPSFGNSFDILDWGSLTGTFDPNKLTLPALNAGLVWNTSRLYTDGILSVTLAGDYNHNGVVDAADYIVWRKGLGTTYTQNDYNGWRAHFGQTAGSGAGVTEPATLVLLLFATAGWCLRQRRAT